MKIWLDDIRPAPCGYIHVRNLKALRALIDSTSDPVVIIEVMSLDHDLGQDEPDGYEIIKWFAENHLNRWPVSVLVHSANPPGAANIKAFDEFVRRRLL